MRPTWRCAATPVRRPGCCGTPRSPQRRSRVSLRPATWLCPRSAHGIDPAVALVFEFQRQFLAARLYDAAVAEHVHEVRHNVVEQTLVVGDDDDCAVRAPESVDTVRYDAERVDVEPGIGLVEDCQARFEHGHLEDLVALLL